MTTNRALVPGVSGGLLAHIEERTRITNRLLGELTSRDTEAFFRRHPEFFRLVISRYYPLNEELVERFKNWWNWNELSKNSELPWSDDFMTRYWNRWNRISDTGQGMFWPIGYGTPPLSERNESVSNELTWSEKLDRTIVILTEFDYEGYDWEELSADEDLIWSEISLDQFKENLNWYILSSNKSLSWSESLIEEFVHKWNWVNLSRNEGLPWSKELIEHYLSHWDWSELSDNPALPWSEYLIDQFVDHWDWDSLSTNEALPWSKEFIEKYQSKWNWGWFSKNRKLPWNTGWGQQYLEGYKPIWDGEPWDYEDGFLTYPPSGIDIDVWRNHHEEEYWKVWTNLSKNEL